MVRRANKRVGKKFMKRRKAVILLATEGLNKTERNYFVEFNRKQNKYQVSFSSGSNTDPLGIVRDACRAAEKNELDFSLGDKVYAVFDTDFGKEKQIREARELAKKNRVSLLLSNPCFEIWILLHFRFSTRGFQSNEEVLNELKNRWPEYRKNINTFSYIADRHEVAIENAKQLLLFHDSVSDEKQIEKRNPSTNVHELVEILYLSGGDVRQEE